MPAWLSRIDKLINEWRSLQPLHAEARKKLEKKFRLEFNYNSNHIEGNTLTYGETELLLIFDDTKGGHTMREYEEMKAHDVAWQMVEQWANEKERPLTEQAIKNLNEVILVRPFWKEAITSDGQNTRRQIKIGDYKQYPNSVQLSNGERFEYASPVDTPMLMQELLEWYRTEESQLHPVTLAAMFHYKFVRIHPFDDGNGRIARLLMNYVFLWNDLPPVIIRSADKTNYLRVLHIADTGDYEPFIAYIADQLQWSLRISIKAAKGENIEEDEDWKKRLQLFKTQIGTSREITIKKGKGALGLAIKNIVLPFLNEWEADLRAFDPLFNRRRCGIKLDNSTTLMQTPDLITGFQKCFDETGNVLLPHNSNNVNEIKINVSFFDLRDNNIRGSFNGGEATIHFYENALNISIVTGKNINRLYSETLTQNDIKLLTNDLGKWFMSAIDEQVKKQNDG